MNFQTDPKLTFDPVTHEYRYDGVKVPSVTQIIESAGLSNFDQVPHRILQKAANLGTFVHDATMWLDAGTLDRVNLDPVLLPYLNAWEQFKRDSGFKMILNEVRLYSHKYKYAGTLDRFGMLNNKEAIPDIKTGVNTIAHGVQLAAYEQLCKENKIMSSRRVQRMTVKLINDGTYSIKPHDDRSDFAVFCNALSIHKYKVKMR